MDRVFVVTDIECDGPVPGENSMLSFASVAVDLAGTICDSFEAVLEPLEEAIADPDTMTWLRSLPDVFAAATEGAVPPAGAMASYADWVRALPGAPVFTAHPLSMDGPWIDHYLRRFTGIRLLKGPWTGQRLFYDGGLCLRSFASGRLGWSLDRCAPENYPPDWLGNVTHTHRAIDDATGYAHLLSHLMTRRAVA